MEWIAHRAGNDVATIAPALGVADAIEIDVHLLRGRLEVRHSKSIWPFRVYWEQDRGIVPDEDPPDLATVLAAAPGGCAVWFDIKGFTPRSTRRVLDVAGGRVVPTMSSRSWWVLGPARRRDVRTCRSIGSRLQLWAAQRIRHPDGVGIPERFAVPEVLERLRARSAFVAVWGVADVRRVAELSGAGVDVLIVDDLGLVGDSAPDG